MTIQIKCCATCKWWIRGETAPNGFHPCGFPLPESAIDYMKDAEKLYTGKEFIPQLMKRMNGGKHCKQWADYET